MGLAHHRKYHVLTDLFGNGVGLLRGAGHHAIRDGDPCLLQQAKAHVLMQRQTPLLLLLLLAAMATQKTRGATENLGVGKRRECLLTKVRSEIQIQIPIIFIDQGANCCIYHFSGQK